MDQVLVGVPAVLWVGLLVWVTVFGGAASFVASTKGRDTIAWFLLGVLIGPFADVVQDFERTPTRILSLLNQMGSEGWELVVVRAYMPPSSSAVSSRGVWDYVLKRRPQAPIS